MQVLMQHRIERIRAAQVPILASKISQVSPMIILYFVGIQKNRRRLQENVYYAQQKRMLYGKLIDQSKKSQKSVQWFMYRNSQTLLTTHSKPLLTIPAKRRVIIYKRPVYIVKHDPLSQKKPQLQIQPPTIDVEIEKINLFAGWCCFESECLQSQVYLSPNSILNIGTFKEEHPIQFCMPYN